jgi:magnesium transporter
MYYSIENGKTKKIEIGDISLNEKRQYFALIDIEESEKVLPIIKLSRELLHESFENTSLTYENHEGFDLIGLSLFNHKSLSSKGNRVCIYVHESILLFLCQNVNAVADMLNDMTQEGSKVEMGRMLSSFFERLTVKDADRLEKIETEISNLDDALISSVKKDSVREIIRLRKRLMVLKRYYEQLLNVLDILQENENKLLDNRSMRFFKIISGRVDRLYHSVLNLRDYVTQVREAYQAQVDISLNSTMKIFTVITAIFLPLTLIVGWYGMNLQMPEFDWPLGYPMVILLSIAVVVLCLVFFKKKKWF